MLVLLLLVVLYVRSAVTARQKRTQNPFRLFYRKGDGLTAGCLAEIASDFGYWVVMM